MNPASLKIVIVGPLPPPAGGMANQTRQLAELLAGEGAVVTLVPVNPTYRPRWIEGIRGLRAVFRLIPYLARLWRAARGADLFHVMANSGWAWHLFAAPAIWIGYLRGVPVVINYRGGEAAAFLADSVAWVRPTITRATALAVPSAFLQRIFGEYGIQSCVVPNIVDLDRFRPHFDRHLSVSSPHLVVARNLEPIYDVGTAIRAFARVRAELPEARLSVAGTGPELGLLQVLARSCDVEEAVTFTGRLDRDEIARLYRSADLVLNPTRVDNMPNSILEALASGVPVVSTDVGGIPFVLNHGQTALLVRAGDAQAMADAALLLLADRALYAKLSNAGLVEVQRYSWARIRDVLFALYADCLATRSAQASVT